MQTDQSECYTLLGEVIPCGADTQDGASRSGQVWPKPRFHATAGLVTDALTGLIWSRDGNPAFYPLSWKEGFDFIKQLNRENYCGCNDWRLPNRRELFSLVSHSRKNPALTEGHPFESVFPGYYWSSTSCWRLPTQAWYVHMGGGRVFKGIKSNSYLVWPVRKDRRRSPLQLIATGQRSCFDTEGKMIACQGTAQDADVRAGKDWSGDRMEPAGRNVVKDRDSGLIWHCDADLTGREVDWGSALDAIGSMNKKRLAGYNDWRLPNIIELESLCHLGVHSPAIAASEMFNGIRDGYWSGTTSVYDPSYAWVFYTEDGNIGVGHKPRSDFHVWAVRHAHDDSLV